MKFLAYLIATLFSQAIFFKLLWSHLLKEMMEFENRVDDKLNLSDKLDWLKNDREK